MLFKGTQKRSASDIAAEMDVMGGQLNAYTTKEYTCYYARVLNDNFEKAADILCDMYFNSNFDEEDISREASVIVEEINMYEDTPDELVFDELQAGIWKNNNALGRPILGTADSVRSFKRKSFVEYMKKHYRPDNTVVAVAGNVECQRVIDTLAAYFEAAWEVEQAKDFEAAEYQTCDKRRFKDIEQVHLCMTYEGVPIGDKHIYDMNVLNTILGGGMSSRLYQTIREKYALAYSIYSYMSCYMDAGIFSVYAGVNPEYEDKTRELILSEINGIFTDKISGEDVEKAKAQIKSNYLLGQDSTINLMEAVGRNMLLRNTMLESDEVVDKINRVSVESMYELAEMIFSDDKLSISIVGKTGAF
jgi:predicted Zn-dependent peptidase